MTDKIAATVARCKATGYDPGMSPNQVGGWVTFTDYEALARDLAAERDRAEKAEAERDDAIAEAHATGAERERWKADHDRLRDVAALVIRWFDDYRPDLIGPRIEGLRKEVWPPETPALTKGDTP
jgi:hypothetical protein